jgi:peptidoglycan hydrolase CwlO-like protein
MESETVEKDQLMEEFENMIDELTLENEAKDKQISELKMRLADLEFERDKVKDAKEELSKRFLVGVLNMG